MFFPRIFLLSILYVLVGSALQAEVSPVEALKLVNQKALDVIYSDAGGDAEVKQAKILAIMESTYDMSVVVKRTMGANWKVLTVEEQVKIVDLVKRLAVRALYQALEGTERPLFKYGKLVQKNSKRAEVPVTIKAGENVFYVDFRFGRMASGWQIFDIVAEDVSFVSNYRQQISDHFRKEDAQALIEKLENILNNTTPDNEIKL